TYHRVALFLEVILEWRQVQSWSLSGLPRGCGGRRNKKCESSLEGSAQSLVSREEHKNASASVVRNNFVEDIRFSLDSIRGDVCENIAFLSQMTKLCSHLSCSHLYCDKTIITVAFNPLSSHDNYELQWKEYPQVCTKMNQLMFFVHLILLHLGESFALSCANTNIQKWENDGQSKTINAKEASRNRNNKVQTNVEDLNPGTTYTVRLRVLTVVASDGEATAPGKPSPELIIDTEAVSCTPKASQCIIL
ncbi:hypothetical protein ACHAWF_002971, partial [Thalassiosira exigua]